MLIWLVQRPSASKVSAVDQKSAQRATKAPTTSAGRYDQRQRGRARSRIGAVESPRPASCSRHRRSVAPGNTSGPGQTSNATASATAAPVTASAALDPKIFAKGTSASDAATTP